MEIQKINVKIDNLFNNVLEDVKSIGFPIPNILSKHVIIDSKRYDRIAACYRYPFPERYEIHLSYDTCYASNEYLKDILAHEIIHANFMTMDHNVIWNMYKDRLNSKLGYHVQQRYSWDRIFKGE